MPLEYISRSPEQTAAVASGLSGLLLPGDLVFLIGQLGTGKTFFIRHAAMGLGVSEPVTSPSFTMAQTYQGNIRVHHLDLYRITEFNLVDAADFEPYFESDAVTFVEWPEQAEPFIENPDVIVRMEHIDINSRRISIECARSGLEKGLEQLLASTGD